MSIGTWFVTEGWGDCFVTENAAGEQIKFSKESNEISAPEETRKTFSIDIFRAWCKACGICAAFCPRECIGRDEEGVPFVDDAERCTGCGWCELHCPDFAISVRPRKAQRAQEED